MKQTLIAAMAAAAMAVSAPALAGNAWGKGKSFQDLSKNHKGKGHHFGWEKPTNQVPEPGTYVLLLAGLAGIALVVRRRRGS
jgi:hypothetical protein